MNRPNSAFTGSIPQFEALWSRRSPVPRGAKAQSDYLLVVLIENTEELADCEAFCDQMELERVQILVLRGLGKKQLLKPAVRLAKALDKLREAGWESRRIFVFGFSRASSTVMTLSLTYPFPLAGVVCSSGEINLPTDWRKELAASAFHTPRLVTCGFFDERFEGITARSAILDLQSVGLSVTYRELNKEHELDEEIELPMTASWITSRIQSRSKKRQ